MHRCIVAALLTTFHILPNHSTTFFSSSSQVVHWSPEIQTKVYDPRKGRPTDQPTDQASEFTLTHLTPFLHFCKIVSKTINQSDFFSKSKIHVYLMLGKCLHIFLTESAIFDKDYKTKIAWEKRGRSYAFCSMGPSLKHGVSFYGYHMLMRHNFDPIWSKLLQAWTLHSNFYQRNLSVVMTDTSLMCTFDYFFSHARWIFGRIDQQNVNKKRQGSYYTLSCSVKSSSQHLIMMHVFNYIKEISSPLNQPSYQQNLTT